MKVVLLHGLGADRRAFQRFERLLPGEWTITALDLLGHGQAPRPDRGYALDDHADYVAQVVADLEGIAWVSQDLDDPPALVGHSYGAAVATAVAALHPNLVRAIVLLDPVLAPADADVAGSDGPSRTEQMMQARREGTLPETVDRLFPDASPALRRWTTETWQRMAVGVIDELDGDWPRFAPRVRCPVTVVHGDVELGGGGPRPAAVFDDAAAVRIAGAGHYLHASHARETAEAVAEALGA